MPFNVVTDDFRVNQADQFGESFTEADKTIYYMFLGRHVPWDNGVVPEVNESKKTLDVDAYSNMMIAKRINPTDVSMAILRIDWTANVVYDSYDHRAPDLALTRYYVGVLEGSNYNVFKCLFNNNGAPSTVAPSFAAFSTIETADNETYDGYYETSDGYQWKYMFTVDAANMSKFATSRYVPLIANNEVSDFAVNGSIDVVKVENGGAGYNNFFYGEFAANSDIAYLGNNNYYAIRTSHGVSPSSANDFYNGCILKITAGKGSGQFREIIDYVNSGESRYAVVNNSFSITPDTTSSFEITPKVEIMGSYDDPAVGRAIMGTGNSIYKVEILDRGRGYFYADAVIKQSNVAVESNTAVLVPMVPPKGGHGSSVKNELNARWFSISVKFSGDENGMIPTGQKFGQVGILKDPRFANIELETVKYSDGVSPGRDGSFLDGETVMVFDPIRQAGDVTVEQGSSVITSNDPEVLRLDKIVYPHNRVLVSTGASWFTSEVVSVNAGSVTVSDRVPFSSANAHVHISYSNTSARYVSTGPTWSYVTDATPFLARGDAIIGLTTYSTAVINDIQINNRPIIDFGTINQLKIISIDDPIGIFSTDELLSDATANNTCHFHSYANANHMYVTNVRGNMDPGTVLRNQTASASISVADKYDGQILQDSGSVIYLENHDMVSRENSTSQTKKIIVEF